MNCALVQLVTLLIMQPHSEAFNFGPLAVYWDLVKDSSWVHGLVTGALSRDPFEKLGEDLAIIKDKLDNIQRGIDGIRQDIADLPAKIKSYTEMSKNVAAFGASLNRLNAFRSQAKMLKKDEIGLLLRNEFSQGWADMIDDRRHDGIYQVIVDIDCMVRGCHTLVGKSILFKYVDILPVSSGDAFWDSVTAMSKYLLDIQVEAYIYLFQALDINKADKSRYFDEFKKSIEVQNTEVFSVVFDKRLRWWPSGTFSLPLVDKTGCPRLGNPSLGFSTGWRYHDTEDDDNINDASSPYGVGGDWKNNIKIWFCNREPSKSIKDVINSWFSQPSWPEGKYCVFKYGSCPTGMIEHDVHLSDEHEKNRNSKHDAVPDGEVGRWYEREVKWKKRSWKSPPRKVTNFAIESSYKYCCKLDAEAELVLPISKSFYLLPTQGSSRCPAVAHMKSNEEWVFFDGDDGWVNPITRMTGRHAVNKINQYQVDCTRRSEIEKVGPKVTRSSGAEHKCQDVKMYFCFYEREDF